MLRGLGAASALFFWLGGVLTPGFVPLKRDNVNGRMPGGSPGSAQWVWIRSQSVSN